MKTYLELFIQKTIFNSKITFYLFFVFPPIIPIIVIIKDFEIIKFNNTTHYKHATFTLIVLSVILISLIIKNYKNTPKKVKNFEYMKYINCSAKAFKFFNEYEKEQFYKTILSSIKEKDLSYPSNSLFRGKYTHSQTQFLKEINAEKYKDEILYELNFERFENEINGHKGKNWIRDIFSYKKAFHSAIRIVLGKISNSQNLENINLIKKAISNNINPSENRVELNYRCLKVDIDNIFLEKSKGLTETNYPSKKNIKTFESSLKILTIKHKEQLTLFLTDFFKNAKKQDIHYLLDLDLSSIYSTLYLKKCVKTFSFFLYKLYEEGYYNKSQLKLIYESDKIKSVSDSKINKATFSKHFYDFKSPKKKSNTKYYTQIINIFNSLKNT